MQETIFVASSSFARPVATTFVDALTSNLPPDEFSVLPWWDEDWKLNDIPLATFEDVLARYDYCVAFVHPEDVATVREILGFQPRDKVIFEFGMFLAILGRSRSLLVRPVGRSIPFHVLSDLGEGAIVPTYECVASGSGPSAIGAAPSPPSFSRSVSSAAISSSSSA